MTPFPLHHGRNRTVNQFEVGPLSGGRQLIY